jgi:hypothetical protein
MNECQGDCREQRKCHSLAPWAAVAPDIPDALVALLLSTPANLWARDALIIAVVPLADVLIDLDMRWAVGYVVSGRRAGAVLLPGKGIVVDAEVEKLKGTLGTLAGGDVSVSPRQLSACWEDVLYLIQCHLRVQ